MVNLRYHIVSLVGVFLALGIGVIMGTTVIDRAIVDTLNSRVDRVERAANQARDENRELSTRLDVMDDFADQARDQLLRNRLEGVPVLVVAVQGIDRKPVDDLRQSLVTAEANVEGTVWFTTKMRLDDEADARALASALQVTPDQPEVLRRQLLNRLAAALLGNTASGSPLAALRDAGFIGYDAPEPTPTSATVGISAVPLPNSRVVLVSGAGAEISDDDLALPFAQALAQANARLVAAESGQDGPGGRGVFVGRLRTGEEAAARLSTVDNLESPVGQAATVLAVEDLAGPKTGHFGVGPGSQRLLPAAQA